MADRVTLDLIDRPVGGVSRSLRRISAIRSANPPGMRALLALGTATFAPRVRPAPTPRRIAVLAAWEDSDDVDARWVAALGELCIGAREHWHVEAELVRAAFSGSWKGWTPDVTDARTLDPAEPALVLISGNLRARYVPAFTKGAAGAVAHAFAQPGYLGGLAINSSPLNTTSCSCWRTYKDARDYAFNRGGHLDAIRRDRSRRQPRSSPGGAPTTSLRRAASYSNRRGWRREYEATANSASRWRTPPMATGRLTATHRTIR